MNREIPKLRKFNSKDASFSFCMSEDDIADPNSFFDVDIAVHDHSRHRPSKSSSDSKEFDFAACMAPLPGPDPDFGSNTMIINNNNNNISTADELFYKGKLLPLYMSAQRLQMPKYLSPPDQSSIAFSCYLHRADVDVDMVMEPRSRPRPADAALGMNTYGNSCSEDSCDLDQSLSSSRESSRNSRDKDTTTSGDWSEESCSSQSKTVQQQVSKNETSGRFRWRVLLAGGQRSRPGGFDKTSLNCPGLSAKQEEDADLPQQQQQRKSRVFDAGLNPTRWSHSAAFLPSSSDKCVNNDIRRINTSNAYQSLLKAKEFWRRYLKPLISRTTSTSISQHNKSNFGGFGTAKQRPRSTTNTPLASPTHSGLLSASPAPDDVQGAIAYCKQTRAP